MSVRQSINDWAFRSLREQGKVSLPAPAILHYLGVGPLVLNQDGFGYAWRFYGSAKFFRWSEISQPFTAEQQGKRRRKKVSFYTRKGGRYTLPCNYSVGDEPLAQLLNFARTKWCQSE